LDGLRGVSALIVAVYHVVIAVSVTLAATAGGPVRWPKSGSAAWWLTVTPVQITWGGPEMVIVLFVLSGYVLALPAVRRGWAWFDPSYYPRRLVRLYLPAWAALVFGVCLHELHTGPLAARFWWLNAHTQAATLGDGLRDATLVHDGSLWAFTSVLWSLKPEVEFSVLLPAFLAIGILSRRSRLVAAVSALACLGVALLGLHHGSGVDLQYLPVFLLGVLLAFRSEGVHVKGRWMTALVLPAALVLMTSAYWWHQPGAVAMRGRTYPCAIVGACLLVWVVRVSPQVDRVLTTRPVQWLGRRSYSIYLVHEPIVVAFAFLFVRHGIGWLTLPVGLPIALLAAEVFWRRVERPAIRVARMAGSVFAGESASIGLTLSRTGSTHRGSEVSTMGSTSSSGWESPGRLEQGTPRDLDPRG